MKPYGFSCEYFSAVKLFEWYYFRAVRIFDTLSKLDETLLDARFSWVTLGAL